MPTQDFWSFSNSQLWGGVLFSLMEDESLQAAAEAWLWNSTKYTTTSSCAPRRESHKPAGPGGKDLALPCFTSAKSQQHVLDGQPPHTQIPSWNMKMTLCLVLGGNCSLWVIKRWAKKRWPKPCWQLTPTNRPPSKCISPPLSINLYSFSCSSALCFFSYHSVSRMTTVLPLPEDPERPRIDFMVFFVDMTSTQSLLNFKSHLQKIDKDYYAQGRACLVATRGRDPFNCPPTDNTQQISLYKSAHLLHLLEFHSQHEQKLCLHNGSFRGCGCHLWLAHFLLWLECK